MNVTVEQTDKSGVLATVLWKVIPPSCIALLVIWLFVAIGGGWLLEKRSLEHLQFAAEQKTWIVTDKVEGLLDRVRAIAGNALVVNAFLDPASVDDFLMPFFRTLRFGDFDAPTAAMVDFTGQLIAANNAELIKEGNLFTDAQLAAVIRGEDVFEISNGSLLIATPILVGQLAEGGVFVRLSEKDTRALLSAKGLGSLTWVNTKDGRPIFSSSNSDRLDLESSGAVFSEAVPLPSIPTLQIVSAVVDEEQDELVDMLHGFLLFAFLADLMALAAGIYLAASLVARPLNGLVQKIQSFEGLTGPDAQLSTRGPKEIAALANAFNGAARRQTDLTERLEESLAKEQELNGLQRQFVSLVSHEFRTPLAIIDGHAQRMSRKIETMPLDSMKGTLAKVRNSVSKLIDLMEKVLNTSKVEAGTIEFNPAPCPLADILNEAIENQQGISTTHKIVTDIDTLPNHIVGDSKLIHHIFSNLLSNAVKYSPNADTVLVTGRIEQNEARISFRDHGVGIPEDEVRKLFTQFFRARTAKGISGTGIGLNLVKSLAEMHGGRMEVESEEGKGSTFSVILPLGDSATGDMPDARDVEAIPEAACGMS